MSRLSIIIVALVVVSVVGFYYVFTMPYPEIYETVINDNFYNETLIERDDGSLYQSKIAYTNTTIYLKNNGGAGWVTIDLMYSVPRVYGNMAKSCHVYLPIYLEAGEYTSVNAYVSQIECGINPSNMMVTPTFSIAKIKG